MDATPANHPRAGPPRGKLAAAALRVVHNPVRLRVLLTALILGGWYAVFSQPMTAGIDETVARTAAGRKRLELAREVERLRAQLARFQGRLPRKTDPNEWVQYMLDGVRKFDLRLSMLDTDGTKDVGPYKAVVIKMQVEGGFHDVDAFLRWVEGNPRLLRVDMLRMDPARMSRGKMDVQMIVLGVMG